MKTLLVLVILTTLSHVTDVATTWVLPHEWEANPLLSISFRRLGFWHSQLIQMSLLILFGGVSFALFLNTLIHFIGRSPSAEVVTDSLKLTVTAFALLRFYPALNNLEIILRRRAFREGS